jgi:DNA-binding FadR family transcriptional regulator
VSAPSPRRDAIAAELRREILRGAWPAGARLPAERDLAARLGVHRSSVREALRQLEQLGLVSIRRGGGATVLGLETASLDVVRHLLFLDGGLDRALLEELLQVHELLVCGATRLAVEHADEAQRAQARAGLARLAQPGLDDDAFIDGVESLLDLIVRAAGNRVLALARRAVNPLFESRFREVRKRLRPDPALFARVAAEVLAALDARDADAAERAVRRFLRLRRRGAIAALAALHRPPLEEERHGH